MTAAKKTYSCDDCHYHVKEDRRGHFKADRYLGAEPDFCNAIEMSIEERRRLHVCSGRTREEPCPLYAYDPFKVVPA